MLYLELVPRNLESFKQQVDLVLKNYHQVDGFNVPDILRISNRSHDVVEGLLDDKILGLPHIRVHDRSINDTLSIVASLVSKGLQSVLFVSGDRNPDVEYHNVSILELVQETKKQFPNLTIYAALDPYRQSIEDELSYCDRKLKAGVDGFFTQPFFDLDLAGRFIAALDGVSLFLGSSPVLTEQSKHYWERVNNVEFPGSFSLNFSDNVRFARSLYQFSLEHNQHCYLMPIKIDLQDYLAGTLELKNV